MIWKREKMNRSVLQKIINYRYYRLREGEYLVARGTLQEYKAFKEWRLATEVVVDDGHSRETYEWIKKQSISIDTIGWENWMKKRHPRIEYANSLKKF
jgi:hypothetical protein